MVAKVSKNTKISLNVKYMLCFYRAKFKSSIFPSDFGRKQHNNINYAGPGQTTLNYGLKLKVKIASQFTFSQ